MILPTLQLYQVPMVCEKSSLKIFLCIFLCENLALPYCGDLIKKNESTRLEYTSTHVSVFLTKWCLKKCFKNTDKFSIIEFISPLKSAQHLI